MLNPAGEDVYIIVYNSRGLFPDLYGVDVGVNFFLF